MRQTTTVKANTATPKPWRRQRRRAWSRPSNLPGTGSLFAAIPALPREELARLTERMIDRIDEIDGDPDLEDLRDDDEDTYDREDDRNGDQ